MTKISKLFRHSLLALVLLSLFSACVDDEVAPVIPDEQEEQDTSNLSVNNWIYETLSTYYYWAAGLPAHPDRNQEPDAFFESLKSEEDRFSVLVPSYQDLINSLSGVNKEAGYEMMLFRLEDGNEGVAGRVLYVKENSPASQAGLKRGDEITAINGKKMNLSNYRDLLDEASANHELGYLRFNPESGEYEEQEPLTLSVVEFAENPHFLDTVYHINGQKIGYYVYNFFSPGTDNTKEYDQQMDQVIAGFKAQGVNNLVLDLRYNSGGAVSSATNLASLIGQNVDASKTFYTYKYNEAFQRALESQSGAEKSLKGLFLDKTSKIGDNLGGKLYVITGSRTASASEMIINGLKPYMDVVVIGDKTRGKNVGSWALQDKENENNHYGMLPIVFQIFNSEGFSDYSTGFVPDHEVDDFQLPMLELGDVQEPLLANAIAQITGVNARRSGTMARVKRSRGKALISTIDQKMHSNKIIMEEEPGS